MAGEVLEVVIAEVEGKTILCAWVYPVRKLRIKKMKSHRELSEKTMGVPKTLDTIHGGRKIKSPTYSNLIHNFADSFHV